MSEEPTCTECGFSYVVGGKEDEERHDRFHDEEQNGPSSEMDNGTYIISLEDSEPLQYVAERAFRAGNRETKYDFPLFTAGETSTNKPVASIQIMDGRVIAGVLTRIRSCEYNSQLSDFVRSSWDGLWRPLRPEVIKLHERRAIEFIWVLKKHRGQRKLDDNLDELERHFGLPSSELSHSLPFTEAALTFWRKRSLGKMYIARPT